MLPKPSFGAFICPESVLLGGAKFILPESTLLSGPDLFAEMSD